MRTVRVRVDDGGLLRAVGSLVLAVAKFALLATVATCVLVVAGVAWIARFAVQRVRGTRPVRYGPPRPPYPYW